VEEGPVELTDAGRVSVEAGDAKASWNKGEIIWDEAPVETAPSVVLNQVRERVAADDIQIAGPPDGVIPEGVMRGAAARSRGAAHRRPGKPAQEGRAAPLAQGDVQGGATVPAENDRPRRSRSSGARQRGQPQNGPQAAVLKPKPTSRTRTLNRWLLVLVPLLVIATVAWRLRRQSMQEYPLIAERGRTEGIPALDAGNFDKAYQILSAARTAVDKLGGDVEGADEIRKAADQAAIFIDLLSETPEDLLAEAGRSDPLSWATRFDTLYKGRAILIDSWITAEPDRGGTAGYDIQYRVLPPGEGSNFREGGVSRPPRIGLIDFTGFKLFELATPHIGQRKIFGARLSGFKYDEGRDGWVIRLEPQSGVFITHPEALEAIGWPRAPDVAAPAEDQR
jgi:hypothetical protein